MTGRGGGFLPRDPATGAAGTLDNDSNLFADRAQLVSGCAAVGSSEVLGGLLRYIKVNDHPIPCTHQSWGRVSLWDARKHLIHSFYPYLVARATGFPKPRLVCKESSKRNLVVCPVPVSLPFIAPFPSLAQTLLPQPEENTVSSLLRMKPTLVSSLPCGHDYEMQPRIFL